METKKGDKVKVVVAQDIESKAIYIEDVRGEKPI